MGQLCVAGAWLLGVAVGLLTLARLSHLDTHATLLVAASTGAPVVLLTAYPVLVVAAAGRRRALAALALLLAVAHVVVTPPLLTGGRGAGGPGQGLRIMTLNVEYDHDNGAAVTRQVLAEHPDVVVLEELSPLALSHLDLTGYAYSYVHPQDDAFGEGIWSRWPVTAPHPRDLAGATMVDVQLQLPSGPVTLQQVHTIGPVGAARAAWLTQLRTLHDTEPAAGAPYVLLGDFNASRSDHDFARLLGGPLGLADAADGRGWLPTWPSGRRVLPPLLRLDHVLVSRTIGVRGVRVLGPTGSDHRALLADLVIH